MKEILTCKNLSLAGEPPRHCNLEVQEVFLGDIGEVNPVPPRLCHMIHYNGDKKYLSLGGKGLNY